MNKLLLALIVFAIACTKDEINQAPLDIANKIDVDGVASDTGTTWRVDRLVYKFGKLGSIYSLNLPDYNSNILDFSSQRIHLKKQTLFNGAFTFTDTLSQLLRVPERGNFYIEERKDETILKLDLGGDSIKTWLAFKKSNAGAPVEGWRSYQINDTDYHVMFTLVPLHAPR